MMHVEGKNETKGWHIGEPNPQVDDVQRVYADGDELDYVNTAFPGFAYRGANRTATWYGCIAATIAANLDYWNRLARR